MSKFKVGDKVVLSPYLSMTFGVGAGMMGLKGKIATIKEARKGDAYSEELYKMEENHWSWGKDSLVLYSKELTVGGELL